MCMLWCVRRLEDSFAKLDFSFHLYGASGDGTQVAEVWWQVPPSTRQASSVALDHNLSNSIIVG